MIHDMEKIRNLKPHQRSLEESIVLATWRSATKWFALTTAKVMSEYANDVS